MAKSANEWFLQSDYDLATAKIMRTSGRNFYAVFMCHMAMIGKYELDNKRSSSLAKGTRLGVGWAPLC